MAEALWKALKTQRRKRAAGSAARQLMTLGRTFPEFSPEKVGTAFLEAFLAPASSDETKTALIQVCGTLGEHGALPTASLARPPSRRWGCSGMLLETYPIAFC